MKLLIAGLGLGFALSASADGPPPYQVPDASNSAVTLRLKQLTGIGEEVKLPEVADPSMSLQADGSVVVSGTSDISPLNSGNPGQESILKWPTLESLVKGNLPVRQPIHLMKQVKIGDTIETLPLVPAEVPWDLERYTLNGKDVLYAGVMTPRPGQENATDDDNISRRLRVAETSDGGATWIFQLDPVFGIPSFNQWLGHSYGHQIISQSGVNYFFHDMISKTAPEGNDTELFARILDPANPLKTLPTVPDVDGARTVVLSSGEKIYKILGVEDLSPTSTQRSIGGHLLEGARPRVLQVKKEDGTLQTLYLILFSTGDYPLKNYTIRAAVSTKGILGPYQVYRENGQDVDLGESIKNKIGLHGLGRGFSFDYQGQSWVMFHAEPDQPGQDYTTTWHDIRRNLYIAPLDIHFESGQLKIHLQMAP